MALLADGELLTAGPPAAVLTSERLASAYGVPTAVRENPVTGTPTVTALERERRVSRRVEADDD
jgi:iron complex transport system ATP-binding protein